MPQRAALLVLFALILGGSLLWSQRRPERLVVSGFVEADEIRIGSRVGGRVAKVTAVEGTAVKRGDVLLELEPFDLNEQRAQAAAMLAQKQRDYERLSSGFRPEEIAQTKFRYEQAKANHDKLKAGPRKQDIAAAKAELELAQAELERAQSNDRRVESLFKQNAATPDQRELAKTELRVATATVKVKTEKLGLLVEGTRAEDLVQADAQLGEAEAAWTLAKTGYRSEDVAAARAAVDAARAAFDAFDRKIEELTVKSPVDGVVEAVELQAGDLVAANAPALSLIDMSTLRVRAYVPENRLGIQLGQTLDVVVDTFPGKTFPGKVTFVARQAEFTPGNVQTPEERSKQVFRIRVELENKDGLLRPGMAADVRIDSAR